MREIAARLVLALPLVLGAVAAGRAETIVGPVTAEVVRVVDGDTLALRARIWLGVDIAVNARIRGVDAPELAGKCEREKAEARAARDRLGRIAGGRRVRLLRIENDKYAGRVVADIVTEDGVDIGAAMLASGLARPHDGGARQPWCDVAALGG